MSTRRCLCVLAVAVTVNLVQLLGVSTVWSDRQIGSNGFDGDAVWNAASGSIEAKGLVPVQNISLQVKVPPGKAFYVYFDEQTQTLKTTRIPDEAAGLPPEAIAAADRAPTWIREDLTKMFARLSELVIDPTAGDDYTAQAFADMNGDGATDLILGDISGRLTLFKNADPALHYVEGYDYRVSAVLVKDESFFPVSVQVPGSSYPTVGDLDGDNLPDLLVGSGDGKVYRFGNAGPASAPVWTPMGTIATIDAGANSTPALADLDGDGDLDLMVGSLAGTMFQSTNRGLNPSFISDGDPTTVTAPVWSSASQVNLGIVSSSAPAFAEMNGDGKQEMVVGEGNGFAFLYRFNGAVWVKDTTTLAGMTATSRATPALADLDDDTLPDVVLGCKAGPLRYYANVGSSIAPKFMSWQNYTTAFDMVNFNQYYWDYNHLYLVHRNATARLIEYANLINAAPPEFVDEIAFSIAKSNAASLLNPSTFPDVYFNNTETLYFNSRFTSYAQVMDYNLGTQDQWSTVRYLMNDSGSLVWYEYPRDIYYWWLVSPKGTDEMATYINPTIAVAGHEGARDRSSGGMLWRWAAFNEASPTWPADPGLRGYPKEEPPPILRTKISNATVLWNNQTYSTGPIYNGTGWFIRDAGGNISRPWNMTNQAVEIVDHWVASTVPLNAQAGGDANRPRQPVRIQWEHNGNCGEISDMIWAALRSAMIPARGICGYGGDHCWGEFYERGWHQIDDYWDASTSIIANNDNYHYGWNRDWSGLMAIRGDGLDIDVVGNYHKEYNASNDAGYLPDNFDLIDRANVTVYVEDADGNPLDGVKVALGDYRYMPGWSLIGTQWTFTNAEGKAYLKTSEARQNKNATNPNNGDTFDDGIAIFAIGKMGTTALGDNYADRLKPSYGDAYNPRNAPEFRYNFSLAGRMPRPRLPMQEATLPPAGIYTLNVSFRVDSAMQHPAVAARWNEGLAYHDYEVNGGERVTSFFASSNEYRSYLQWRQFQASNVSHNTSGEDLTLGIPAGDSWYFVLSNPGTLETTQIVNLTASLLMPTPEQKSIAITPSMLGRRLMSLPLRPIETDVGSVLSTCAGSYDYVRWYDPSSPLDQWRSYSPGRQHNSLLRLDETMGFWINFTSTCTWTVTGFPAGSTAIGMRSGWNLVGYPSEVVGYTVAALKADLGLAGIRVESYDPLAPQYNLWRLPDSYSLKMGEGYWVYVPQDCTWLVVA